MERGRVKDRIPGNTTIFEGDRGKNMSDDTEAGEEREGKGNLEIKEF